MVVDTSRLLPGRTTADASELWPELSRRTLLLPVVLAVAAGRAVGALAAARAAHLGRTRRANGLFVGGGDNLRGKVQPSSKRVRARTSA